MASSPFSSPWAHTLGYPPNGFNCRYSVIALAERDIQRRNLVVGDGASQLEEVVRHVNKTPTEKTVGLKIGENKYLMADKGFDYNVGRTSLQKVR